MSTTRDRLRAIETNLNERFAERSDFIEGLLVAALSGQHIFVLGPPGAGKTEIITEFAQAIDGDIFDALLMKTTTPDELFGPPDLPALKETGVFRRNTAGMAPEAHVLCLDEIWKGGSATLNGLLRMLAQGEFNQGGTAVKCPLLFAVGASNELPEDPSLRALYSRFQLRFLVQQVQSPAKLRGILWGERAEKTTERVSIGELREARAEIAAIPVSDAARKAITLILDDLREAMIIPDVRKLVALVSARGSVVQAMAWLDGEPEVLPRHLSILRSALWDIPKQIDMVDKAIEKHISDSGDGLLTEANDVIELANGYGNDPKHGLDAYLTLLKRANTVLKAYEAEGRRPPQNVSLKIGEIKLDLARTVIKIQKGA